MKWLVWLVIALLIVIITLVECIVLQWFFALFGHDFSLLTCFGVLCVLEMIGNILCRRR